MVRDTILLWTCLCRVVAHQLRLVDGRCLSVCLLGWVRTSFRSVKEAMEHARDGDHIILRAGIHNGLG
jgi:hypothetical protein